jgi:lycopene beta-cyclase
MRATRSRNGVPEFDYDIAILGGGLHGGLVAAALSRLAAPPRVLLVDSADRLAGNHVWSCHAADVGGDRALLESVPTIKWPGYDVRFPGLRRTLPLDYRSMHSHQFAAFVFERLKSIGADVWLGRTADWGGNHDVRFEDGSTVSAAWILIALGRTVGLSHHVQGWQKFLGLELEFEQAHGVAVPCVMDAADLSQSDGYRFVYTLPFTPTRMLVEDTCYSDDPSLDADRCRRAITEYVRDRGWGAATVVREERGALPIPYCSSKLPQVADAPSPTAVGWRGGWFHSTTGYSFGLGVRVATAVARSWERSRGRDRRELQELAARTRSFGRFGRRLNRMLFTAFRPEDRIHVLERFHRVLSDDAVARFYALNSTAADRWKLLVGRPPRGFSARRMLKSWWNAPAASADAG